MKDIVKYAWFLWGLLTGAQLLLSGPALKGWYQQGFGAHPLDVMIAQELVFGQVAVLGFALIVTAVCALILAIGRFKAHLLTA